MIDAWEIIGRWVTDAAFATAIFNTNSATGYPLNATHRVKIPEQNFTNLRAVVASKLNSPVSLMALGEILVAMRFPKFGEAHEGLKQAIAGTAVNTTNRNSLFYTALGAAIVDPKLRQQIATGSKQWSDFGFHLTQNDVTDANAILRAPAVQSTADVFCMRCWSEGCNLKTEFWPSHAHPLESFVQVGTF